MKYILLLLTVCAVSCTSKSTEPEPGPVQGAVCALETALVAPFASTIADQLACTGVAFIQVDLLQALGSANLCPKPAAPGAMKAKGVIGDIICPTAVAAALVKVGEKVPAKWACSPNASSAKLGAMLIDVCKKTVGI